MEIVITKYTEDHIKEHLESRGFTLLEFLSELRGRDTRIKWQCSCGVVHETNFKSVENRKTDGCKSCMEVTAKIPRQIHVEPKTHWRNRKRDETWQKILDAFSESGCKLLTTREEYTNNSMKLRYICHCGGEGNTAWRQFSKGTRCPAHSLERRKETTRKKYGVDNVASLTFTKEKAKKTNLERRGYEYSSQSREVKDKILDTNKRNHGGVINFNRPDMREATLQGHIKKYGCAPGFSKEIKKKGIASGFKQKDYRLSSGKIVKCRGYEKHALDLIFQSGKYDEEDIIIGDDKVPKIKYCYNNRVAFYHPDIAIVPDEFLMEVKSEFTCIGTSKEKNIFKWDATVREGFNLVIAIFKRNGKLDRYFHWNDNADRVEYFKYLDELEEKHAK